jgi:hypothetical protein
MVIGTTFVAPPFRKWAFKRFGSTNEAGERRAVEEAGTS